MEEQDRDTRGRENRERDSRIFACACVNAPIERRERISRERGDRDRAIERERERTEEK